MKKNTNTVDVEIYGKRYTVGCSANEHKNLQLAVKLLNDRMAEAERAVQGVTTEMAAVMVALDVAHELVSCDASDEKESLKLRSRLAHINDALEEILEDPKVINTQAT